MKRTCCNCGNRSLRTVAISTQTEACGLCWAWTRHEADNSPLHPDLIFKFRTFLHLLLIGLIFTKQNLIYRGSIGWIGLPFVFVWELLYVAYRSCTDLEVSIESVDCIASTSMVWSGRPREWTIAKQFGQRHTFVNEIATSRVSFDLGCLEVIFLLCEHNFSLYCIKIGSDMGGKLWQSWRYTARSTWKHYIVISRKFNDMISKVQEQLWSYTDDIIIIFYNETHTWYPFHNEKIVPLCYTSVSIGTKRTELRPP